MTTAPAITSVSLFAIASVAPHSMPASVGSSPAAPTTPLSSTSGRLRWTSSVIAPAPASTPTPSGSAARSGSAACSSAIATSSGITARACSASNSQFPPAANAHADNSGCAEITSSVCRPILPVEPRIVIRLGFTEAGPSRDADIQSILAAALLWTSPKRPYVACLARTPYNYAHE